MATPKPLRKKVKKAEELHRKHGTEKVEVPKNIFGYEHPGEKKHKMRAHHLEKDVKEMVKKAPKLKATQKKAKQMSSRMKDPYKNFSLD